MSGGANTSPLPDTYVAWNIKMAGGNYDMPGGAGESERGVLSRSRISRLRGEWRGK